MMNKAPVAPESAAPERRPPLGSWGRLYAAVVAFFVVEVVLFTWLTWSVS